MEISASLSPTHGNVGIVKSIDVDITESIYRTGGVITSIYGNRGNIKSVVWKCGGY